MPSGDVVNIQEKFGLFSDHWSPKRIGELNGQQILLAKVQGEFVYHKHDDEDELFMVIKGQLILELGIKRLSLIPVSFTRFQEGLSISPPQRKKLIYCCLSL